MPQRARKSPWPWVLVLALLGAVYALWILPHQLGSRPVEVEFAPAVGVDPQPTRTD